MPLPDLSGMKVTRHTRGNAKGLKAERPGIRTVPLTRFGSVANLGLVTRLFGHQPMTGSGCQRSVELAKLIE
jgi:hypothetical protein